jgi:hypothetical protein
MNITRIDPTSAGSRTRARLLVLLSAIILASTQIASGQDGKTKLEETALKHLQWRSIGPAIMCGRIDDFAVVEGNGQESPQQFARFVRFSLNSSSELEYHLMAARDVEVMTATDFKSLTAQTVEVRKMLYGLLRHLERSKLDPARSNGRSAVTKP